MWKREVCKEYKCKECRLEFLAPEGMFKTLELKSKIVQTFFFCFKCWDKSGKGEKLNEQLNGNSTEDKYKRKMIEMIEAEWDDERKNIEERIKNWSLNRLISRGYCRKEMSGRRQGKFFDKKKMVFNSTAQGSIYNEYYSQIQFSNGDEVTICRENPLTEVTVYRGEVQFVEENGKKITICSKDVPPDLATSTWRIDVGANKISFERQLAAIDFLCKRKNKDNVCPSVITDIMETYVQFEKNNSELCKGNAQNEKENVETNGVAEIQDYILKLNLQDECKIPDVPSNYHNYGNLNASQMNAVNSVLLNMDPSYQSSFISVIQGPPGTGKTTTIANLIAQIIQVKRNLQMEKKYQILVCADSNVAVDELLKKLVHGYAGPPTNLKVIRLGSCVKIDQELHKHSLPYKLDNHSKMKEVDQCRQSLDLVKNDSNSFGVLTGKDNGAVSKEQQTLMSKIRSLQFQMTKELLNRADVICSTLVGCGADALKDRTFPIIVQDEATQATEPRSLIAIQRLEPCSQSKIIIVGDQNQLPPTVISRKAENKGLKISLFDRIAKQKSNHINYNMLQVQYRMDPILRAFPSKEFYHNKLKDGVNCSSSTNFMSWKFDFQKTPLIYIDTSGLPANYNKTSDDIYKPINEADRKEKQSDSGSKYNKYEVELIKHLIKHYIENNQDAHNPFEIGIITPYSAQVKELKKALWEPTMGQFYKKCEIKTVDGFQGREKDLIIFSCVRTEQIGFLNDYRRLNVAITRARKGLIVIGNSVLLKNDPVWFRYLTFMRSYNL